MNAEVNQLQENIDDTAEEESSEFNPEATIVLYESEPTDNVGDVSVEINVEELISKIETESDEDVARKIEIRRRLEEVAEEQSMEDTFAIDLSDDAD